MDTAADNATEKVERSGTEELAALYRDMQDELLVPLWHVIDGLMPTVPTPHALAHRWQWRTLAATAARAGALVPVGRGGERRAIALANPGLGGAPYATPTLWAAIQYLNAGEDAPVHRHSQHAFRFVIEGQGVATVVDGDPVTMRRGDFLPQAGWHWHGHLNDSTEPMAWIDGLDVPLQRYVDATFFEVGPERVEVERPIPDRSRSERLWGAPGLAPLSALGPSRATPLLNYRWEYTDAALDEQLRLEAQGHPATVEPGHAAVRYLNPTTGTDALPTIRAEFHRLAPGTETALHREVGSAVLQVFEGSGHIVVGEQHWDVERGDLVVVPSFQPLRVQSDSGIDLFRFSDTPVIEKLGLDVRPEHHGAAW